MLLITTVGMIGILSKDGVVKVSEKIGFDSGWLQLTGNPEESIEAFHNEASFTNQITLDMAQGKSLCFFSKNVYFDVLVDGNLVYSYRPSCANLFGKFYGILPHEVQLDTAGPISLVEIRAESIDGSKGSFTNISIEDGNAFLLDVYRASLLPYCVSVVIGFMGFLLVLGGLSILQNSSAGKEIAAMGLFALDAGVWTACSTDIAGMIIGTPVTMHFVNYVALMLLPPFGTLFVFLLTGRPYKKFANVIMGSCAAVTIANLVLVSLGVTTYHKILFITHILGIIAVIYAFICIVKALKSKKNDHGTRVVVTLAFVAVASGSFIDLIRYSFNKSSFDPAYFFRIGMMLFVFILGIHEIYALMFYRKFETEAEKMSKLAYTDALTGLQNRMAFTNREDFVNNNEAGKCIVIQFDINNLKTVNDNYGHKEGDKHIKAAADIIDTSFGQIGSCYRTGGDEFIVVVENLKDNSFFELAEDKFRKLIEDYNETEKPRVKLEIAYGVQEFDLSSEDVEGALRLADGKMYVMKKQMKGN